MSHLDRYYIRQISDPLSPKKYYQVIKISIWQANQLKERGEKIYESRKQAYKVRKKMEDGGG